LAAKQGAYPDVSQAGGPARNQDALANQTAVGLRPSSQMQELRVKGRIENGNSSTSREQIHASERWLHPMKITSVQWGRVALDGTTSAS
jgi:hypothetical protein